MTESKHKLKVLGIGFDYQSIVAAQTRGDFLVRFVEISRHVDRLTRIIYCPASAKLEPIKIGDTGEVIFTNSKTKLHFYLDLLKISKRLFPEAEYDVITTEDVLFAGLGGLLVRRKFKKPLNVQTFDSRINNPFWLKESGKNHLLNAIAKFVVKRADTIRVVAECTKKNLIEMGIKAEKIFVVPTIIDVSRFDNVDGSEIRKKYLKNESGRIVMFVGRLSKEKNIPMLIRAFASVSGEFPDARLLIVGGGPEREKLEALAAGLGLGEKAIFAGPVEYDLIPQYHAAADIFVLPSFHEGRANVLVEAALASTPIIATDAGDAGECIQNDKNGFLVRVGNQEDLENKIILMLKDPEMLRNFNELSRKNIIDYLTRVNDSILLIRMWCKTAYTMSRP